MIIFGRAGAIWGEHVLTERKPLEQAIREADWDSLLPRLATYAENRLRRVGWAAGRDHEPSAASVQDTVNLAIERCLDGSRKWTDDAPEDLERFLCGVIKSIVSSARKSADRDKATPTEDAGEEVQHHDPLPDEILAEGDRSLLLEATAATVEGDEEQEQLYLAILDGYMKREELAEVLGWTVDAVTAKRIKLQRRLVAGFPELFAKYKQRRKS